ncbi:MAG: DUF6390 family protein [Thermodesulfobacteriota bacterium]
MPLDGTIIFARYAFMPNRLRYCGGTDNQTLFEYCAANRSDPGLVELLGKFQAALPYLKLIARSSGLPDPFDPRVVEAYWLGNELLDKVDLVRFYNSLRERLSSRVGPRALQHLLRKPPQGARPHHSFHVFDVHSRAGALKHSLGTMESCRIGWGRITEVQESRFTVLHRPLVLEGGRLELGREQPKTVLHRIDGTGFIDHCEVGDWISFHWDWACDTLTARQVRNLAACTRHHLHLANQTL